MLNIEYKIGDATKPQLNDKKVNIISHIVNNAGQWGAGFVVPLGNTFPKSKVEYVLNHKHHKLGDVQLVTIDKPDFALVVSHLYAQDNITPQLYPRVQYDHLKNSLEKLFSLYCQQDIVIHMPRIGTGIGGGTWEKVLESIQNAYNDSKSNQKEVFIIVYDLSR